MEHYAGIDVSLECSSVCVVDASGKIVREGKVASEPEALIAWFGSLGFGLVRIGLEAGPLSQWLYAAMQQAGLAVELLETRHVRDAFKAMPVKSDRKDARGIAQLMRLGWFRPVHCKSLAAQEMRAFLTARKLVQSKLSDIEMSLRGILRGFGLKVGPTTPTQLCRADQGACQRPSTLEVVAAALLAAHAVLLREFASFERSGADDGTRRRAGTAVDVGARRRRDRRADLCVGDRRSGAVQVVKGGWRAFRADAEEVSIRREGYHRQDLQDRRRVGAHGALPGRPHHPDPPGQGSSLKSWAMRARQARRNEERPKWRWRASLR